MEKKEWSLAELRAKAEAYCASQEHCEQDVRTKLFQWGAKMDIEPLIEHLYEENFLNESRYCRAYVHDKLLYQGWGRVKIRMMLQAKRLSHQAIEEAIRNIDETEYNQILKKLIQKKNHTAYEQTVRFCMQRGFEYEVISALLTRR